jgi:hypothetical protein
LLFLHTVHFLVGIGAPWFDWFDKRGPSTPISIDVWRAGRFIWKASLFNNYANDFVTACGFDPVSRGSGATAASRLGIRTSPGPTMALSDMHRGVEPGFFDIYSLRFKSDVLVNTLDAGLLRHDERELRFCSHSGSLQA